MRLPNCTFDVDLTCFVCDALPQKGHARSFFALVFQRDTLEGMSAAHPDPQSPLLHLRQRVLEVVGPALMLTLTAFGVLGLDRGGETPFAWVKTLFLAGLVVGVVLGAFAFWACREPKDPVLRWSGSLLALWATFFGGMGVLTFGPTPGQGLMTALALMLAAMYRQPKAWVAVVVVLAAAGFNIAGASLDDGRFVKEAWLRGAFASLVLGGALAGLTHVFADHLLQTMEGALSALHREEEARARWLKAQREVDRARRQEALRSLAGNVAHNVNNALLVVEGNASLLLSSDHLDDDDTEMAQDILSAARETALTVKDLLQMAVPPLPTGVETDTAAVVRDAMAELKQRHPTATVVVGDVVDAVVSLPADELEQLLCALVQNAIEAQEESTHTEVHVSASLEGETWVLRVRDAGVGLTPAVMEHLFEPFFTTKSVEEAMGLSLSMARSLVERCGGTLSGENLADGGALFTLKLPTLPTKAAGRSASMH